MFLRFFTALLLLGFAGVGFSQRCLLELQAGLETDALSETATGRDAAIYLERAVNLLEPVLPQLLWVSSLPLPEDDPDLGTVQFLAERRLLPSNWHAETLELETWQEMLSRVTAWYGLEPEVLESNPLTRADLVESLSRLIERVSPRLKPVALVASDPRDQNRVAFWGIVRNDTVYPRMIVVRPPEASADLRRGVEPILPALGTCAMPISKFVFAPANTAERLFLAHSDARMIVAQTDTRRVDGLEYVPVGQETAYFTFADPSLAEVGMFAALFDGPTIGVTTLMTIIPRLRTNMGPREIIDFVRMP